MEEERAQGRAFRAAARADFQQFTADTSAAHLAAMAEDDAQMDAIIAKREESLDARLDAQQTAFEDAMEQDRAEMKQRLKEVYNYNTYEFEPNTPLGDHISAPYSHEQHRAFLNRFAYYMKDVLADRDNQLARNIDEYNTNIASRTEAAVEQNEDLQRGVQDVFDAQTKADTRLADNLLEAYAEVQDAELAVLGDARAAAEAGAHSRAEELRKQIIYAMHILRYAGGEDSGAYGFGNYGSSYYGKGNSLTGIDTLDHYRLPNSHGYAQVQDVGAPILKLNNDEENRGRQEESLENAKIDFDAMVQACRDEFGALVATEQAESNARREQVNSDLHYATSASEATLAAKSHDAEDAMAHANDERKSTMQDLTDERVDQFQAVIDGEKAKVHEWFGDQVHWAEKLYDSYYKEHLLESLATRRDATIAALDARAAQAA